MNSINSKAQSIIKTIEEDAEMIFDALSDPSADMDYTLEVIDTYGKSLTLIEK